MESEDAVAVPSRGVRKQIYQCDACKDYIDYPGNLIDVNGSRHSNTQRFRAAATSAWRRLKERER